MILFFGLTILLSYAMYFLPLPRELTQVAMVFVPALVAFSLTAGSQGSSGLRHLLRKAFNWKQPARLYLLAIGLALALRVSIGLIAVLAGWVQGLQFRPWSAVQLAGFAIALFVFALLEEIGWRGFALPRLLERMSPTLASLVIGGLWGIIHLALHLPGMPNEGLPALLTLAQIVGLSVMLTCLYILSGGSVFLTSLFHAAQTFFVVINDGISAEQQAWLMAGVYLAVAVALIFGSRVFLRRHSEAAVMRENPMV